MNGHILTPPGTFYNKATIQKIQQQHKDQLAKALANIGSVKGLAAHAKEKAKQEEATAVALYKTFRKHGDRNETYSTVPGIKIYTSSSGLLYVTDSDKFPEAELSRSDFQEIGHNAWLLELPTGIFAQGGIRGVAGEEMTFNQTTYETKNSPKTSGQFNIPLADLYRIEGTSGNPPDLWQNRHYTWDFRPRR